MTPRSRSDRMESDGVPGPLYEALSLCASKLPEERVQGIKQFGQLGQQSEVALGSVLRIFVCEREPLVKSEMQTVLVGFGPAIIQPSLEMIDEIIHGAAAELTGVLLMLARARLEPFVQSAERIGAEAWERVASHWGRFEPMIGLLIDHWLAQTGELEIVLGELLVALRPISILIMRMRAAACADSESRNRILALISRCGNRGQVCLEELYLQASGPISLIAATLLAEREQGIKRLMELAEGRADGVCKIAADALLTTKDEWIKPNLLRLYEWLWHKSPEVRLSIRRRLTEMFESRDGVWKRSVEFFPPLTRLLDDLSVADERSTNLLHTHGIPEIALSELVIVVEMIVARLQAQTAEEAERATALRASIVDSICFCLLGVSDPNTRDHLATSCQGFLGQV